MDAEDERASLVAGADPDPDPFAFIDDVCSEKFCYSVVPRSAYDGDTVTVDIKLGFNITLEAKKLRLYGLNTPEVRGKDKTRGRAIRDEVHAMLQIDEAVPCTMYSIRDKTGKYGRYLAVLITPDGTNLNKWLLSTGRAERFMA